MFGIKRGDLSLFSTAGLTATHINIGSLSDLTSKIFGNISLQHL